MNIILGSQSPRRRELMAGLGIPFTAISIHADESFPADLQGGDIPAYISRAKAGAYAHELHRDQLLITSDTIVWLNGGMLGKPRSADEARHMLRLLSGQTHQVYTAVSFSWYRQQADTQTVPLVPDIPDLLTDTLVDKTDVSFNPLTGEEIDFYVSNYSPLDKAGAYGVQEWIGYVGVRSITGSFYNVMGFPIAKVYNYLKQHNFLHH